MEYANKSTFITLSKIVGYFVLFYLCLVAKILGSIAPAFYAMFLAIIFLGENAFYASLSFLSATAVVDASTKSLVFAIVCAVVGSALTFAYKKLGRNFATYKKCLYAFALGVFYIILNFTSLPTIYLSITNVALNVLFLLCCSNVLKILKMRRFNLNLNVDEILCACVIVSVLFCGIANLNFAFDVVKFLGYGLIMLSFAVLPGTFGIVLGIVCGLGAYFGAGDASYITLFSVVGLFNFIFKNQNKIYGVLSTFVADILLNLLLNTSANASFLTFLPTICACATFMLVPTKLLKTLKTTLFNNGESGSLKNILNQNKAETSKKLRYTAEIFYEMDKSFRKLVKGNLDPKSAKTMLCSELIRENCETCHLKNRCLKGFNSEHRRVFENLINAGFEKGKITLVDLPSYLTSRCARLNQLIVSINNLLADYKNYAKVTTELDSSKLLVAEQLKGISNVLTKLSDSTQENVVLDSKIENLIKENLTYNDIVPVEVVCFERDTTTSVVSMMIRNIDFDNEKILKVLGKICKHKMVLSEVTPTSDSNLSYVCYKTAPNYEIAVGVATDKKGGSDESGDSHALVKLDDEKFMLALVDGMGSGKKAAEKSETSLNIIENFYKAGYDDETILSSVNKLLNLNSENVFSAVDLSVVNLKSGEVDFIKQGATVGFVKTGSEVHRIESNSLPLGILDSVTPKITKTVLSPNDTVLMMSDGIVDAIGENKLEEYLSQDASKSPQDIADRLLQKAKSICGGYPDDDMTVIACKIFYNAS